jgi:hypothetical protein
LIAANASPSTEAIRLAGGKKWLKIICNAFLFSCTELRVVPVESGAKINAYRDGEFIELSPLEPEQFDEYVAYILHKLGPGNTHMTFAKHIAGSLTELAVTIEMTDLGPSTHIHLPA